MPNDLILKLLAGITALLLVASLVGFVLHLRQRGNPSATITNLNQRIKAWWWMVAVLATCFWLGAGATVLLFAFASLVALREFVTLTPTRAGDHWSLVAAFYVLLPVQYWLIYSDWYGLFAIFVPVYGMLALPILAALQGDTDNFLERTTKLQWGVLITVYFISYAPALLLLDLPGGAEQNLMLLFYLLLVVQISDVLQYVCGKLGAGGGRGHGAVLGHPVHPAAGGGDVHGDRAGGVLRGAGAFSGEAEPGCKGLGADD
jgi:phosphatidate cytidylyltransferase